MIVDTEIVQEFQDSIDIVIGNINNYTGKDFSKEIRDFLVATAISIWSANGNVSVNYPGVLHAIDGKIYTIPQIEKAMETARVEDRTFKIPDFLVETVKKDKETDVAFCRNVVSAFWRYTIILAEFDGETVDEEVIAGEKIIKALTFYCNENNIRQEMMPEFKNIRKNVKDVAVVPENNEVKKSVMNEKPSPSAEFDAVMEELNSLIGLDEVKNDVNNLVNFIKISKLRKERGFKTPTISYHLVFTGNPGTGKTTVARLVAKLYHLMGILPTGQLVETDRSGLVAGYLGQTAIKTQEVIESALGGVLFIDEAYSLNSDEQDFYGKEAIETLLKAMEDHRDELVVIVAGYDDLMHKFIDSNPGLRSRFNKFFHFPDYNGGELLAIFERFCHSNGYTLAEDGKGILAEKFEEMFLTREQHFGNARMVRNLFEHAINSQANRLVLDDDITDEELTEISCEDVHYALEVL